MTIQRLTKRQKEVFDQLLTTKIYPVLHDELKITPSGLSFHCKNIYEKLDVTSRVELLIEYKFQGLPIKQPRFAKPLNPLLTEIFTLTVKGYSISETAQMLNISKATVQHNRLRLYWSAGVETLIELLFLSYNNHYDYEGVQ